MAFPEQYANGASSTLSGAITSGTTSMAVTSGSLYPSAPQFRTKIESELILVTGVTGNVWAVSRGIEGTTAAAHADGAAVTHLLTAAGLAGICGRTVLTGTLANLPATGVIGRQYLTTDCPYLFEEGSGGWAGYGPLYSVTPPPALSGWTWVNQGTGSTSGSAVQVGGTAGPIRMSVPAIAAGTGRLLTLTAPVTGYTLTVLIAPEIVTQNFASCGIGWRDSISGKLGVLHFTGDTTTTGLDVQASYAVDAASLFTAHYVSLTNLPPPPKMWFQLQDDGVNRTCSYSRSGAIFTQLDQRARNYYDGSSTMTPDQVFIFVAPINGTFSAALTLLSWTVTHP